MKWFISGEKGVSLGIKEWNAVMEDAGDASKMTALGRKIYRNCLRSAGAEVDEGMDGALMAFANVLNEMKGTMDNDMWANVRWSLEEEWRFSEKALWESPEPMMKAYGTLSNDRSPLLTLGLLEHDLLNVVRPNLYRLVWAMLVADGRNVDLHGLESADASGLSLMAPISMLDRLMGQGVPDFLDEKEAVGLWHLRMLLDVAGDYGVETDELLQAAMERKFVIEGKVVRADLYMHSREGTVFTPAELDRIRSNMVQALSALITFKVMLIAMVIGEKGPVSMRGP